MQQLTTDQQSILYNQSNDGLRAYHADVIAKVECEIAKWAGSQGLIPLLLKEAMLYSLMGGKYLRSLLICAFSDAFELDQDTTLKLALASEMVQAYSLIHDDLPCMDNSQLRRGKPSCWVKYGESTAVLTGDALLTEAFSVLSTVPHASLCISALCHEVGARGMIAGQIYDLQKGSKTIEEVEKCQTLKTSYFFRFCCSAPALVSGQSEDILTIISHFSILLGLNYQMVDDLLDAQGESSITGKTTGLDRDKSTFVSYYGVDVIQKMVTKNTLDLRSDLKKLRVPPLNPLWQLIDWLTTRKK